MGTRVAGNGGHNHVSGMDRDQDTREHANLEAQRTRSNVYAFRKVKWGDPRGALRSTRVTGRRPAVSGFWTLVIFGVLAAGAIALLLR